MINIIKSLIARRAVVAAPVVTHDSKTERDWVPLYNCP